MQFVDKLHVKTINCIMNARFVILYDVKLPYIPH